MTHAIEYSKSSRARCHGSPPCQGTLIDHGSLRYGQTISGPYGETVQWRHWGCVTPTTLGALAITPFEHVTGFQMLRPADQQKVRRAIALRRVDPSDIPDSAKTAKTAATKPSGSMLPNQSNDQASSVPSSSQAPSTLQTSSVNVEEESEVDDEDPEVQDELYCSMSTNVVGIQYYKGLVGPKEEVLLVRESRNPYDCNAIQVKNIGGTQVGHLRREIAAKLAPLLDKRLVTVEGVIHEGNPTGKSYSLSMTLKIYGASDRRDYLEPLLIWATPRQRGFPPRNQASTSQAHNTSTSFVGVSSPGAVPAHQSQSQMEAARKQQEALAKAAELKQMLRGLEKVDDESRRSSLLDTLCSTDDILKLPEHSNPPGISSGDLKVDLLKHQRQALKWCIDREYPVLPKKESDRPVQFWQLRTTNNKSYYYNIATKTPQDMRSPPPLGRGALFADAMGLGKTLTMLALIISTKTDVPAGFSRSSLIVLPLSVMSNWQKQIEDHCLPDALSYCVYYGANRSMSATELEKYDVVITTYQMVTSEHNDSMDKGSKKRKREQRSLFEVQWKRIILDEGHCIRNSKTKMARGVCELNAQRRWILTGTPIINSPRDLGSILTFLRICQPLDNEDFFRRLLLRPLKDGLPSGAELLRALMSQICIRRTKEMQDTEGNYLIPLPPVEMIVVPVTLDPETRALYDEVEQLSKQRFKDYMTGGARSFMQSNVLGMLTRLRQLVLHPGLVSQDYLEELHSSEQGNHRLTAIPITPELIARLQNVLAQAIEDNEECPICFDILKEPRITPCTHRFCLACIAEVISRDPKCPMDRRVISMGDLIAPLPPTEMTQVPVWEENNVIRSGSSAKIEQLIHLLKLTPSTEKSLVFSQFTSFLDKISDAFDEQGIPYVRFDGQMSAKRRQEAIARFSVPLDERGEDTIVIDLPGDNNGKRRRIARRVFMDDVDADDADENKDFLLEDYDFIDDDINESSRRRKGKGKKKSNVRTPVHGEFSSLKYEGENPRVMLISLKAGALGLNLTVANNVFLMDPWWQEGIESQAIDRCNRIGQTKPVHVYQLVAENTVESKVIEIQERKKALICQAFSGIKRTEIQREKKEARLQDLIELFGLRQQHAASQATD